MDLYPVKRKRKLPHAPFPINGSILLANPQGPKFECGQRHKMPMADIQSGLIDHGELLRWLRARAATPCTVITGRFDDFEIGKAEEFVEIFDLIHLVFRKGHPSPLGDDQEPFMDTTIGEGHPVFLSVRHQSTPPCGPRWMLGVLFARVYDGLSASPGPGRSGRHASLVTTHHACAPMPLVGPSVGTTIPYDSTGSIYFNAFRRCCPAFSWHRSHPVSLTWYAEVSILAPWKSS